MAIYCRVIIHEELKEAKRKSMMASDWGKVNHLTHDR